MANSAILSPCFSLQSEDVAARDGRAETPDDAVLCLIVSLSLSTVLDSVANTSESFRDLPDAVASIRDCSKVGLRGGAVGGARLEKSGPPSESSEATLSDRICVAFEAPPAAFELATGLRAKGVNDESPSDASRADSIFRASVAAGTAACGLKICLGATVESPTVAAASGGAGGPCAHSVFGDICRWPTGRCTEGCSSANVGGLSQTDRCSGEDDSIKLGDPEP